MPSLRELLGFGKSEGANNLVILNGYPLAVVVAISLHMLLLGGLVYLQSSSQSQALELIQPTVIKALLIEENPQITNQRNQDNRRLEAKREEQATERKRPEEAAQKREQQQVAKQRADAKVKAEREKTLAEDERKKREAERQREAEDRREEQAQREREFRQQREREDAQDAAAAEAASSEFELIQSATGLIQQLVTENWSRPPSALNGMRAIIQINMLPTG